MTKILSSLMLICVVLITVPTAYLSGQELTFRFDPPDSITFIQHLTTTRVSTTEGAAPRTDVTVSRTEIQIQKGENGFTVRATPLSITLTRNGQEIQNPLLPLLLAMKVTIETDERGEVLDVHGYGDLATLIDSLLPPAVAGQLGGTLTEQAMVAREISEWNDRIADMSGLDIRVGDTYVGGVEINDANGVPVTSLVVTEVKEIAECKLGACAVVSITHSTEPASIATLLELEIEDVLLMAGVGVEDFSSNLMMRGESKRVIYVNTLLYDSEITRRVFTTDIDVPGEGTKRHTQEETREYSFEYPAEM